MAPAFRILNVVFYLIMIFLNVSSHDLISTSSPIAIANTRLYLIKKKKHFSKKESFTDSFISFFR